MMGGLSIWHWLIIAAVVAIFFGGAGRLSGLMGDAAKGIKAFREGLKDDAAPEKPADPVVLTVPEPAPKRDEVKS